jgi:hypothetical protein
MARGFGWRRAAFALIVAFPAADAALARQEAATTQARSEQALPENVMKVCGDRWRVVKQTEAGEGLTWTRFLARCRAEFAAASATPALAEGSQRGPQRRAAANREASPAAPAANVVFPDFVSPRYAGEKPHRARQKTCSDQFQANKATGGNGGLRWVQKGGGYWSQCNARLKQTRA